MRSVIAPVKNLQQFMSMVAAVEQRSTDAPGIAVAYGPPGFGKSTSATHITARKGAALVRALAAWTLSDLLHALAREVGVDPAPRNTTTVNRLVERLVTLRKVVIIDEADYVVARAGLINTVRDLQDLSGAPFVLLGMENFARKITQHELVAGRVYSWVKFAPADLDDVRQIHRACCEVAIDEPLMKRIAKEANGSARRAHAAMAYIERFCAQKGLKTATAEALADRTLVFMDEQRPGNARAAA